MIVPVALRKTISENWIELSMKKRFVCALTVCYVLLNGSSSLGADTKSLTSESHDIVLVRDGKPVHNMICLPNDQADPAAVLALKEYRTFIGKATGTEPVRVAEPVPGVPTIFFGQPIRYA